MPTTCTCTTHIPRISNCPAWADPRGGQGSLQGVHPHTGGDSEGVQGGILGQSPMQSPAGRVRHIGFFTGILWVRISHTIPVPANTVPITGMGTYHTVIHAVSDETHGIPLTCSILIIKITIIITLLRYYTKNGEGISETVAAHIC